jgi:ferredoxin
MEVEIRFEREDRDGIVAVGTYIADAMKRMGIRLDGDCASGIEEHCCVVSITGGSENLSPLTVAEEQYFADKGRGTGDRLACQAKIIKGGEVTVMTKEKKEEQKTEDKADDYKKQFNEMPLEQKIANLVQLEAITLGETFSFIINSPFKVFEKAVDVMAEFGFKMEKEAHDAKRPQEHRAAETPDEPTSAAGEAKSKKPKGGDKATA